MGKFLQKALSVFCVLGMMLTMLSMQAAAMETVSSESTPTDWVMELEEPPRIAEAVEIEHCHPMEPQLFSDNGESTPYVFIAIMNGYQSQSSGMDGVVTLTDYSKYPLCAYYRDSNGTAEEVSAYCEWSVDTDNAEIFQADGQWWLQTYATQNSVATVSVSFVPNTGDGIASRAAAGDVPPEFVIPLVFSIQKLNLTSDRRILEYAALSKVIYTNFASTGKIEGMIAAGTLKDGYNAKDEEKFIATSTNTGATWSTFYSATISDWELCHFRKLGGLHGDGFYGALFKNPSGGYVLAFRGTDGGMDVLNDIALGLGNSASQLKHACEYYDDLVSYGYSHITLTGHSLGGGMANYVSVLRGVPAVTFNAPSTMVSAVISNTKGFAQNFRGLNDKLRTDYVNFFDWVGNTGVGDNKSSTLTSNITFGNWSKGGLIDRTKFVHDQSPNNGRGTGLIGSLAPHHFFNQMLEYNKIDSTIAIRTQGETNPTRESFLLRLRDYVLGSTDGETLIYDPTCSASPTGGAGGAYVFGGDGNDTLKSRYSAVSLLSGVLHCTNPLTSHDVLCGGRGDDIYTGNWLYNAHYLFSRGDDHDTIHDYGGSDYIYIYGYDEEALEVTTSYNAMTKTTTMEIREKGGSAPIITADLAGIGSYTVINGETNHEIRSVSRLASEIDRIYVAACPVDMNVYDASGSLVCTLRDGVETEELQSFGCFSVVEQDGEYIKAAMLYEDGYTVRLVGTGKGEMNFSNIIMDENGTIVRSVENIPVTPGATYTAVNDAENDTILLGDGNLPDVVFYAPESIQVNADKTTLRYGERTMLHASVYPETAITGVIWISSDTSVAFVDQDGVVTAVGAGTAEITAVSSFDDTLTAACPITVSDETFSMDSVEIGGIEPAYVCTGYPVAPDISASLGAYSLIEGIDYSAEYENNVDAGTATVTLTGNGYFEGTRTVTFTIRAPSVSEKVDQLVEECLASGAETDYDKALWFHDWLIYHADYDHTYQSVSYRPEGVLLNGRGVCQSYADAYSLLLTAVGIENIVVTSYPMNHAWNIVKIDEIYTHIDCTWDDPNSGGLENHTYFGLGDREMELDHTWSVSLYPECQKLRVIVEEEDLPAPYDLFDPVAGVDFTLIDSSGNLLTRESIEKTDSNILLVFGRQTCSNTRAFLDKLSEMSDILKKHGTQVIAVMESMEQAEEIAPLYPFTCAYEADCGYEGMLFNQRIGLTSGYTYPQVVLQNSRGSAFYYSTGYVYEPLKMVSTAIQDLPLTDRIPYSPTYLYSSEDEMYACIRTALANRETDIKLCNPAYASVSSDDRSAAVDYVLKNAASYGGTFDGYYTSFGTIFIVCVEYASEDSLPDPDPFLDTPLSGIDLSFADASGKIHSSSEYGNVLLVYGRAECPNTQSLLRSLHMWKDVLDRNDVTVIAVLESQSDVAALSDLTPFQCMADTDGRRGMWNVLDQWGTLTSVTYPAVFFQADTGEILYVSTGYVYEPDKLVATVIQGRSDNNDGTYSIFFDANGGTVDQPNKMVAFGGTYGTLPTPTRAGYSFGGWFTATDGGIEVTSSSLVSLTEDQTLYARWVAEDESLCAIIVESEQRSTTIRISGRKNVIASDTIVIAVKYDRLGRMTDSIFGITDIGTQTVSFSETVTTDWFLFLLEPMTFKPLCEKLSVESNL